MSFVLLVENDMNIYVEQLSLEEDGSAIADAVLVCHFGEYANPPPPPVTDASNTTPIVVTAPGHGLINGDLVIVSQVRGNNAANGLRTVANVAGDTFELAGSVGDGDYFGGGVIYKGVRGGTGISLVHQGGDRYLGRLGRDNDIVAGRRYATVIECTNYGVKLEDFGLARVRR